MDIICKAIILTLNLCYGLLALALFGLITLFACWVCLKATRYLRKIHDEESLFREYKGNRDKFMYWKYMVDDGHEEEILNAKIDAVAELERIQEFTETDFLDYLNNVVHPECGYSYYLALFDLLCEVTNWQYKDWQKGD